jgi:nucleolar protein 56
MVGVVPEALQVFLDKNVPQSSKKEKVVLGVSDAKLGASISEALNITCQHTGAVPEILRGIVTTYYSVETNYSGGFRGSKVHPLHFSLQQL